MKPFAVSYIKLLNDDGTALQQGQYKLAVYKIDKKLDIETISNHYLQLHSSLQDAINANEKSPLDGFTFNAKDSFVIRTNLCSTKLTQDVKLLSLLKWQSDPKHLEQSLKNLLLVEKAEIVKSLQDILDVLFRLFNEELNLDPLEFNNAEIEAYRNLLDQLIFSCIVRLIDIVSDPKYKNFESVLDSYINESFSATLVHSNLSDLLTKNIFNAVHHNYDRSMSNDDNQLYEILKHLPYIMKFIIRSRILYENCAFSSEIDQFDHAVESEF